MTPKQRRAMAYAAVEAAKVAPDLTMQIITARHEGTTVKELSRTHKLSPLIILSLVGEDPA
jgi:hypothetical protein